MVLKDSLKTIIKQIPIRFTSNQKYDAQTKRIMSIVLEKHSTFVDVGCHKGEVLSKAMKIAFQGKHFAYEPIPSIFEKLNLKYGNSCVVKNLALGNKTGKTSFNHVVSNPAYSGIKKRAYPKDEKIVEIEIPIDTLDNQLLNEERVDLIKIDVEGGEFDVFKGAVQLLRKFHPVVVFEHGLGAADFYNANPKELYDFLEKNNYCLYTLHSFIENLVYLSKEEFIELFNSNKEYYFLAKFKA
ncbi:MAG: FkbM family methyltransferase [Parvicellaceae bacterium]